MKIKGSRILVTGGTRGLGRQFALDLARAGANVGICSSNPERLAKVREEFAALGLEIFTYLADISVEDQVHQLFAEFAQHFGGLDAVINNAGITRDSLLVNRKNQEKRVMPLDCWTDVIGVNLTGVFLCGREAADIMASQETGGVIISISSVNRHGCFGQTNYSAAKAGVASMTVVWAKELARYGIRVAALAPGYIRTDMTTSMSDDARKKIEGLIPLKRFGTAEEVSHALRFILENDYITGRVIDIDGGMRV